MMKFVTCNLLPGLSIGCARKTQGSDKPFHDVLCSIGEWRSKHKDNLSAGAALKKTRESAPRVVALPEFKVPVRELHKIKIFPRSTRPTDLSDLNM